MYIFRSQCQFINIWNKETKKANKKKTEKKKEKKRKQHKTVCINNILTTD